MSDQTQSPQTPPAPGWYPDQQGTPRYWDGGQWTGAAAPGGGSVSQPRNGLGIAALILGLIGVVAGLLPILFWLSGTLGLIGIILGLVAVRRARRKIASNGKTAWSGLIASVAAFILGIVGMVSVFVAVDEAVNELDREMSELDAEFERDMAELDAELEGSDG